MFSDSPLQRITIGVELGPIGDVRALTRDKLFGERQPLHLQGRREPRWPRFGEYLHESSELRLSFKNVRHG